ncbi:MAG: hypothetical protein ACE5IH_10800 [Thermodesulfobacteriota bacterium]
MKRTAVITGLLIVTSSIPSFTSAIETAPRITDREIVETLTEIRGDIKRLEEGQKAILREMDKRFGSMDKRFGSMDKRFEAIDSQFDRITNIMLGILGAFVVLLSGTIWFALWDRRTMIRPFETRVKVIEEEIASNRTKLHSLLDALRTLSKTDERVGEVLKRFNLL